MAEFRTNPEKLGANGIILYPPSLVTPADGQLLGYFKKIAEQVDLPVVIQDAPRTTGVSMSTEFILNAFDQIENFKFIKVECPLTVHKINRIANQTRHGLRCFSGNGGIFTVDAFIRGAWGVMPGVGIVRRFVNIYDAYISNDITKARDIFENILPLLWFEDQSLEFFIACEKEILSKQGVIDSTYIRAPKFALDSESLTELNILYDRLKTV
jgi:4-hydroxy-tetrahydrodipicolinate synthase